MSFKYFIIGVVFLFAFFFLMGCSGWNENTGAGECSVGIVTPLYNGLATFILIAAFTGIFWMPVLFIAVLIIVYVKRSKEKAAAIAAGTYVEPVEIQPQSPIRAFFKKYKMFIIFALVVIWAVREFMTM